MRDDADSNMQPLRPAARWWAQVGGPAHYDAAMKHSQLQYCSTAPVVQLQYCSTGVQLQYSYSTVVQLQYGSTAPEVQ